MKLPKLHGPHIQHIRNGLSVYVNLYFILFCVDGCHRSVDITIKSVVMLYILVTPN